MQTLAFLYKWTHIPTGKWYVGSRSAKGCHPDDGYICSSKDVEPMILESRSEWKREILVLGNPKYIRDLESTYLTNIRAAQNPNSFNKCNSSGKVIFKEGRANPMKDAEICKKQHEKIKGDNHWTRNLNGKPHPQVGQKRPTITGVLHPNKNPINAEKIRKAHKGRPHDYMLGDKNVMKNFDIALKISGKNHWVNKPENRKTCEYCGIKNISKSNYSRWHGDKCKHKG